MADNNLVMLPKEIIFRYLLYLDPQSLQNACQAHSVYAEVCNSNYFWWQKLRIDYNIEEKYDSEKGYKDIWKDYYIPIEIKFMFRYEIVDNVYEDVLDKERVMDIEMNDYIREKVITHVKNVLNHLKPVKYDIITIEEDKELAEIQSAYDQFYQFGDGQDINVMVDIKPTSTFIKLDKEYDTLEPEYIEQCEYRDKGDYIYMNAYGELQKDMIKAYDKAGYIIPLYKVGDKYVILIGGTTPVLGIHTDYNPDIEILF